MITGISKLYQHPKAKTMYLTIPSRIATDSTFNFKAGDKVSVIYDPSKKQLIIKNPHGDVESEIQTKP